MSTYHKTIYVSNQRRMCSVFSPAFILSCCNTCLPVPSTSFVFAVGTQTIPALHCSNCERVPYPPFYRLERPNIRILDIFNAGVHPDLMRCMNRVYLRGCEAKYLEPLLGTSNICQNPPASGGRFLQNNDSLDQDHHVRPEKSSLYDGRPQRFPSPEEKEQEQGGNAEEDVLNGRRGRLGGGKEDFSGKRPHLGLTNRDLSETEPSVVVRGTDGSAGSLVIHIRSGDIFLPRNIPKLKHSFHTYGQVCGLIAIRG